MKQIFIFIILLLLLGCNSTMRNNAVSSDFNCPRIFFSQEDKVYINRGTSVDDIQIKAEFNNFAINKECQKKQNTALIPIDVLIVVKPMDNIENSSLFLPIYISLLDANDKILETQYFSILGSINKDSETNDFIESDIKDKLTIVTKYLNTSQLVIGFMLNEEQRGLLN